MVGDNLQGKYFSITDPSNISTVIYQVNKTEREFAKNGPKYTVERLEYSEEFIGENIFCGKSCSRRKSIGNTFFCKRESYS